MSPLSQVAPRLAQTSRKFFSRAAAPRCFPLRPSAVSFATAKNSKEKRKRNGESRRALRRFQEPRGLNPLCRPRPFFLQNKRARATFPGQRPEGRSQMLHQTSAGRGRDEKTRWGQEAPAGRPGSSGDPPAPALSVLSFSFSFLKIASKIRSFSFTPAGSRRSSQKRSKKFAFLARGPARGGGSPAAADGAGGWERGDGAPARPGRAPRRSGLSRPRGRPPTPASAAARPGHRRRPPPGSRALGGGKARVAPRQWAGGAGAAVPPSPPVRAPRGGASGRPGHRPPRPRGSRGLRRRGGRSP